MYILGIETTTPIMSIALSEDEKLLEEVSADCGQSQVVEIIPRIDNVLEKKNMDLSQIDLIGVDIGPGMFTGTRIGLTVAKTLSQVNSINIVGVTSLNVLAYQAMNFLYKSKNENIESDKFCIFPIINAKREEIYCSIFTFRKFSLKKIDKDKLLKIDKLEQKIIDLISNYNNIILCGNGVIEYKHISNKFKKEKEIIFFKDIIVPEANAINSLAFNKYLKGKVNDFIKLTPKYVRQFKPFRK